MSLPCTCAGKEPNLSLCQVVAHVSAQQQRAIERCFCHARPSRGPRCAFMCHPVRVRLSEAVNGGACNHGLGVSLLRIQSSRKLNSVAQSHVFRSTFLQVILVTQCAPCPFHDVLSWATSSHGTDLATAISSPTKCGCAVLTTPDVGSHVGVQTQDELVGGWHDWYFHFAWTLILGILGTKQRSRDVQTQ